MTPAFDRIPTLTAFLESSFTYLLPPPGGSIRDGGDVSDCPADAYLAGIAGLIKRREMTPREAVDCLWMKVEQVRNQEHFGVEFDVKIIERLGAWARELSH